MDEHLFVETFKKITAKGLPGFSAHASLIPTNRIITALPVNTDSTNRSSAVGVILHMAESKVNCILIQRPDYVGFHGGQVSFPGGKMDEGDPDLEFTARRECFEEINLPVNFGVCIGELSQIHIPVSSFVVHPYVFFVDQLPYLTPDPREVETIISFDVFELLNKDNLRRADIKLANGMYRKDVPFFDIKGYKVWGATAMMLAELKAILEQFD